jgi:transposase
MANMNEASYEAPKRALESGLPEQIDIRVRRERRRRWTQAEKLRIVREAFAPGAIAQRVAERHEISTGLLFTGRRQVMASASGSFLPVQVAGPADQVAAVAIAAPPAPTGVIEIDLPNGVRMRLCHGVDLQLLRGLLAALDGR